MRATVRIAGDSTLPRSPAMPGPQPQRGRCSTLHNIGEPRRVEHPHAVAFASVCESLAEKSLLGASSQELSAARNERSAVAIPFDGGMGGGGGAVGWSMAADKLKKHRVEYTARTERQDADRFRTKARELREASAFLLSVVP